MNILGCPFPKRAAGRPGRDSPSPLMLSLVPPEDENLGLPGQGGKIQDLGEPVVTQPSRGNSRQPLIVTLAQSGGNWNSGLFGVCGDKRVCFCGLCCLLCLECDLARHYGECLCWPLLPGSTLALRVGTRERHRIKGTLCEDWMVVHCCWPFAVCQMARELTSRAAPKLYEVCSAQSLKKSHRRSCNWATSEAL
ncbi:PLAC8-like protein 1 [Ornithorhynchus anatinus]|uniref:PLAC8 like 1 n=1 Tax=Ornithorhynchus anatinus TaxID=9258 RepID=K7EH55_ORNAN|nr:PLAC8-like protein 1 [Ornithorhynchus anatinus]